MDYNMQLLFGLNRIIQEVRKHIENPDDREGTKALAVKITDFMDDYDHYDFTDNYDCYSEAYEENIRMIETDKGNLLNGLLEVLDNIVGNIEYEY